ncbi:MAG: nitroreductase family protein [Duncaniella sp.]|nr:nitroreductase family protein [Duncaniella sp.]
MSLPVNTYFTSRATVRKFDHTRQLSAEMLTTLLAAASHAPNTGNMQTYCAIVSATPEEVAALALAHFSQPAASGAQALVTFCADLNRFNRWCRLNNAEPGLDNLQGFLWAAMDATIFAQQFVTVAEQAGLGTCYLGTTTYNAAQIAETLDLPVGVVPVISVAVGWPAEMPQQSTERLPLEAVAHVGKYRNPSDGEIREMYAEEEALPANREFVAANGKENLAQVFAQIRYPKEANEHFSRVYREFIKSKGIEI